MPNTTRVFSFAGYSTRNGKRRIRVTSRGPEYQAILEEEGDTDVELHRLPHMMSKGQAKAWLKARQLEVQDLAAPVEALPVEVVLEEPAMTLEEALEIVPKRNRKGHPIKKAVRQEWAEQLIAAL